MLQLLGQSLSSQSVRNAYTHTNPASDTDVDRDVSLTTAVPRTDQYLIQIPRARQCLGAGAYVVSVIKRAYWLNTQTVRVAMRHLASAGGEYGYDLTVDILGPFKRVQYVTITTDFNGTTSQRITKTAAIEAVDTNKALIVPVVQSGELPYMYYSTVSYAVQEKLWFSAANQISAQFRQRDVNYSNYTVDLAVVEV